MYTIKEAAARTGVTVELLRAWERRYGVVAPTRTSGGYRLYDDAALARLRTMRSLVGDGWTPSAAAAAIRDGRAPAVEPLPDQRSTAPTAPAGGEVGDGESGRSGADSSGNAGPRTAPFDDGAAAPREAFLAAAARLDEAGIEEALDAMLATGSFEAVADHHLQPTLAALGDGWEAGRIGIAGEHAASGAVLRRLAAAFQAAGTPSSGDGPVLVGLPPGARHELGALMFAIAARRAGLAVLYLGPDLPLADWVSTAERTKARAAVIGAPMAVDVTAASEVGQALRQADPTLPIAFGGAAGADAAAKLQGSARAARARGEPSPGAGAIVVLDADLRRAVAAVAEVTRPSGRRPRR